MWLEAQRVCGNLENICLEKSGIMNGAKSATPSPDFIKSRPVARGAEIKKAN